MSTLQTILQDFRDNLVSERDKGTDFEQLCLVYLRNEAYYRDLYEMVWSYADWAAENGLSQRDTGACRYFCVNAIFFTTTGER